ncbi:MAG: hypothetical protein ACRDG7_14685 [Candidatus Limnocylindria bacterium]
MSMRHDQQGRTRGIERSARTRGTTPSLVEWDQLTALLREALTFDEVTIAAGA